MNDGRRMKEDENRTHALRGSFSLFSFAKNWQISKFLPFFSLRMTKGFVTNIVRFVCGVTVFLYLRASEGHCAYNLNKPKTLQQL